MSQQRAGVRRRTDGRIVGDRRPIRLRVSSRKKDKVGEWSEPVEATVYEHLAVHRTPDPYGINEKSPSYQVTHVPTGYGLPGEWPKLAQAREYAQRLQHPAGTLDWSFTDPKESKSVARRACEILQELRGKYGLEDGE